MTISVSTPQIGLRLVGMADGSTAIMTERGELLARQGGISLNSTPGGETIVTAEFVVDHDNFRLASSPPSKTIKIDGSGVTMSGLEEAFNKEIEKIIERVSERTASL